MLWMFLCQEAASPAVFYCLFLSRLNKGSSTQFVASGTFIT